MPLATIDPLGAPLVPTAETARTGTSRAASERAWPLRLCLRKFRSLIRREDLIECGIGGRLRHGRLGRQSPNGIGDLINGIDVIILNSRVHALTRRLQAGPDARFGRCGVREDGQRLLLLCRCERQQCR